MYSITTPVSDHMKIYLCKVIQDLVKVRSDGEQTISLIQVRVSVS